METTYSLTGHFERDPEGTTFFGYIEIDDDRISCRLLPQKDSDILKLERFEIEAPISTGKAFTITKEK
jgi:hypothetical protein